VRIASANLSVFDLLNRGLVGLVRRLLDESALPADRLCLEITESALMDEPELALQHLAELAALGVKLSIDDYGSGQASLAYVKTLPVHELKIDRIFVDGVDADSKNAAIVRSTILLCRELGLSVVAEGAETPAELAWLRDNGCDLVQGYVVARPLPLSDFLAAVRANAGPITS
jgi:EAL domain-containing protein (putative c-di-GMP-specific phosphodiesterase class I)